MKKRTILGMFSIIATFLMISTATIVPVSAVDPSEYSEDIDEVLDNNSDTLEAFDRCINDYIAEHGQIDQNFTIPQELEQDLDVLIQELESVPGQPAGGGVNFILIWYEWFIFCHVLLWVDDFWSDFFSLHGNVAVGIIAAILIFILGLDPSDALIITVAIAIYLYGVALFFSPNEGKGIVAKFEGVFLPYDIKWVKPQT